MGRIEVPAEEPEQEHALPAEYIKQLLVRTENPFEVSESLLLRLETTLAHRTELHSLQRRRTDSTPLHRCTLKHTFLLADGSTEVLWEVEHNTGADGRPVYEVYTDSAALERAEELISGRFGITVRPPFPHGEPPEDRILKGSRLEEQLLGLEPGHRDYRADKSAEHARKVLNRAANADSFGEETRSLLETAFAHETIFVTDRRFRSGPLIVEWSLYEHAFLLAGGDGMSLWEVEYSVEPGGGPVCEVHLSQDKALDSMDRHW
jgi:hypothetical protein